MKVPDWGLTGPVDYVPTGHVPAFSVRAVQRCGPMMPELFYGYLEVEFGLRLRRFGCAIYGHGELCRKYRKLAADRRERNNEEPRGPILGLRPYDWRRCYTLRNEIYVLRSSGHTTTALRVAAIRGILKPLAWLPFRPREAAVHLQKNARAILDGWMGRLGRTLEPD